MARTRHSEENRIFPGRTSRKVARTVEFLRARASTRKLLLLEAALVRSAPFAAGCGRTIWDLLQGYTWFRQRVEMAGGYKEVSGHEVIEILEQWADGQASDDEIGIVPQYTSSAEYSAEADRFGYDAERAVGADIRYGVAYWLLGLDDVAHLPNAIDFYIAGYTGEYYAWGSTRPHHPEHGPCAVRLIHDLLSHPLECQLFRPEWRTSTVHALAKQMYVLQDFSIMPLLADALTDAGCDNEDILLHCLRPGLHTRGCWVIDFILGKH